MERKLQAGVNRLAVWSIDSDVAAMLVMLQSARIVGILFEDCYQTEEEIHSHAQGGSQPSSRHVQDVTNPTYS